MSQVERIPGVPSAYSSRVCAVPEWECQPEAYIKPTGYYLNGNPILQEVGFTFWDKSEGDLVAPNTGIYVNDGWSSVQRLGNIPAAQAILQPLGLGGISYWQRQDIAQLRKVAFDIAKKLEKQGFYRGQVVQMMAEYQMGRRLISEIAPKCLAEFSQFNIVVDKYDEWKYVMLVNLANYSAQLAKRGLASGRAIRWNFYHDPKLEECEFNNSVGDVKQVTMFNYPGDNTNFMHSGLMFYGTDFTGVYYPTEDRKISFRLDDTGRQKQVLDEGILALSEFLTAREEPKSGKGVIFDPGI